MARRRPTPFDPVPARLARFRVSDWPAASPTDAFELWRASRSWWSAERAAGWPGGNVDRLREERRVRRALHGWGSDPS